MEQTPAAQNHQNDREARKAEQAKHDRGQARTAKLKRSLRLSGLILAVIGVVFGLVWLGEQQDNSTPQPSPISNELSAVDHVKGAETAVLTLIEYSDFQCPTCKAYAPVLEQLLKQYPEQLRVVYRYFPLQSIHPNANIASQAAEAASLQGKFWEMHDLLFAGQTDWSRLANPRAIFTTYAEELGLNTDQFLADLESKDIKNRVNADYRSGLSAGVQGTPSFFMNGQPLDNPRGLDGLQAVIEAQLP